MLVKFVASHHVRVVDAAENLDLAADLVPYRILMVVPIYHFQGIESPCGTVYRFVDGATAAVSYSIYSIQVREAELLSLLMTRRWDRAGSWGQRKRNS